MDKVRDSLSLRSPVGLLACAGFTPAPGQCRLCTTKTTALTQSLGQDGIQLEIQTSLDFDRLVLAGDGSGAAVIRPDGSNVAEGALSGVSARAMGWNRSHSRHCRSRRSGSNFPEGSIFIPLAVAEISVVMALSAISLHFLGSIQLETSPSASVGA